MAPIRVGFLGLSKEGWAPEAHLPYLKASPNYEIVALCNSSVESSRAAIKAYSLPESTKAYGDPQDLANDKDIDLVVCSVRVDRHLATISPSLKAGKDVFVEWPLGKSAKEARELLRLKNEGGVKNAVVGLQGRQGPIIRRLKELVDSGRIGKVLSSTWTAQSGDVGGPSTTEGRKYLIQRETGGNILTIHFGHSVDYIQQVLGYGFSTVSSILPTQRKTVALLSPDGSVLNPSEPQTASDTIYLHGVLASGIPISLSLRGGPPFPSTPGLVWSIYGSHGEIRLTAGGPFLQMGYPDTKFEVQEFGEDGKGKEVQEISFDDLEEFKEFPPPGRNVARVYKLLAEGGNNCTFEDAVKRHEFIEGLYKENGYIDV